MTATFPQFRQQATIAIEDIRLQGALDTATGNLLGARRQALAELPDSEKLRDHFKSIRARTLADLARYLEIFERNAVAAGVNVHWASTGEAARKIVIDIAEEHGVTLATKSKSMTTEEIHLNDALVTVGVEPVETDLGEWIIQLAQEPPFHIIGPAIHKTREQAAELISEAAGRSLAPDDIAMLTAEARRVLREKFLAAGMGISGGNIAIAETGSVVLVTNEGNGRLVTSAPPVHVAVIGIEKVVPTWDGAAAWLALLARSATGQPLSVYTSIISGPARNEDPDGPREVHVVFLDNGRSRQIGGEYEEVLQCIRCGACLNVCPVYREAGGHAYGSPYNGPIGSVITPLYSGLREYEALPHACSLCQACKDICPVRIDLPRMLLALRETEVREGVIPWPERKVEEAAGVVLAHERLLRFVTWIFRRLQGIFLRDGQLHLPRGLDPTVGRRMPGLAQRSFRTMWQAGELEAKE